MRSRRIALWMEIVLWVGLVLGVTLTAYVGIYHSPYSQKQVTTTDDWIKSTVLVYNEGGHGSGVVVGPGIVLTAKHVAVHQEDSNGLTVRAFDGTEYPVIGILEDPNSDAALLLIDGTFTVPALSIDTTIPPVGAEVVAIGTPYDKVLFDCVLFGRVVKTGVDTPDLEEKDLIILDAHLGPGCSGGPVIYRGKIVGIVVNGEGALSGVLPVSEFIGLFDKE